MSVSSLNWGSGGIVGAINELMDNVTGESQITHSALGLISFSDVDIDRYHSITVTGPDGAIGGFTAMVADPATGDGSGTVLWQYSVPDAATEHLGEGETVTEVFTMHLTDDQGEEVTQDVTVTVTGKNDAPEIIAHSPDVTITALADGSEGEGEATHTATGSVEFDDLDLTDSHTLTVFSPYGHRGELVANIVQSATGDGTGVIEWSYVVSDGSLDDLSSGDTFIENFLLQIDDGHGGVVLTSVNVTLSAPENAAPVISADISAALSEDDAPTIINLLANASDSDGDDLDVHNASISVSDGRPLAYSLSSETGGLAFDPGQFNYLTEGESVTITVSYNVTDGSATVPASAVIVIEGRNDGPVAVQDVVLATEDTTTSPVTGNVLSNDTDVDGDALEVISVNGEAGYVGQQINGVYGLITIGANGSYSYVLDNARQAVQELAEGQVVSESFSYQIRDEHGETAIASVEVTVVGTNDSPVVAGVDLGEVDDDETRIITAAELLANSSDIDGDALSVVSVSIAAEAGSVYDNGDGTWTFVPQLGYVQDDVQIEFVVSDGTAETTGTASIDVLLGNEAPVAGDDTVDVSANAPTVISAEDLLANDQDVDGDALEIVSVEAGAHGTVALDEDGNVVFTPEDGYTGDASFSYTVSDGQGGTDSATVQVSVTEVQDEGGNVTPNASEVWDTAQLSNGGQVVIWHNGEGLTGSNIYAGDGSVVKSHYRLPGDPTNLAELKVEGLANGGFVVAGLNSNNRVVFAVYNNEGLLSRSWQPVISESYPHGVPDIIATQGGGFTLVMHGNRGTSTRWDTLGRRYDANGNALGDVFEINAPINGDTHANGIELADGRLMLFSVHRLPNNWQVTGQVFSAEGSALGEAFDVASSTSGIDDFVVAPIRLNDGRIALTVGGELHIYSVDGTNSVVEDVTVSFGELGGSAISDLVALADGGVFVLYTREEGDEYQVFGQRYDASGNLVGDEVVFGELSVGSETMARLEPSTDGGADVVYLSNGTHLTRIHVEPEVTGETVDRAQFRDEQHAPVAADDAVEVTADLTTVISASDLLSNDQDADGDTLEIVSVEAGEHGAVSLDENGNVVFTPNAGYTGGASFSYTVSDGAGGLDRATVIVDVVPLEINSTAVDTTIDLWDVAQLANGNEVSVWRSSGDEGIYATIYRADGSYEREAALLSETTRVLTQLHVEGLADGGFVVAGRTNDIVTFSIYDASGNMTSDWQTATGEDPAQIYSEYSQRDPEIIALRGGGFLLTLSDKRPENLIDYDILVKRYDADGNAMGDGFKISSSSHDYQSNGIELPDGRLMLFVVSALNEWSVTAQIFSLAGEALGDAETVWQEPVGNSSVENYDATPILLVDGRVALIVRNQFHVYSVDADNAITLDFSIDINTGDVGPRDFLVSDMVALEDGGIFAVMIRKDGAEYEVYGQRYDANGEPISEELVFDRFSGEMSVRLEPAEDGGAYVTYLNADGSASSLNRIHVNSSLTGDTATRGQYRNDTPIGNDMMSGDDSADTFIFGNGGDADVILDADNSDHIEMTSGVDAEDVWFLQNGEDLVIQLLGHQDNLTVSDWFDGTGNHLVNYIELGSGASLDGANVQALVDAMSVFGVGDVIADTIDRNSEAFSNVQTVIAANWQN
ncbi:cadherin-like domain-containing protein [Thalassospira sp. UBA1131]|uniref:cadherin-like domain-containing protein n=1 Tax=Thalassospira sp. UBA1131 TaxID=1947672 RepID=UPI0025CC30DD|nr:cadherin-like domain-containing protein [Thalassospira sp. UBA1131]